MEAAFARATVEVTTMPPMPRWRSSQDWRAAADYCMEGAAGTWRRQRQVWDFRGLAY